MDTADLARILTRAAPENRAGPGTLPTGSVSLDILLGGGWRKGAVSELYGPPDSGTTTVALRTIAAVQRACPGQIAVICDSSPGTGSRLPGYAASLGADLDRLVITTRNETLPSDAAVTVIDGFTRNLLLPREDLDSTVLVIPRKPGLVRAAASVRMDRSYGARWTWAELMWPVSPNMPPIPISLGAHPQIQEILQLAISYGLAEVHGKRWYYCGQRKFAGGWHDAVQVLRDDAELREKIISGIAEKTGQDASNWLTSPALCG